MSPTSSFAQEQLLLSKVKEELKKSQTVQDLFKEYDRDLTELNLVPMCFSDELSVSARTQHGIIIFNSELLKRPEDLAMYGAHELTHNTQQLMGSEPTTGSDGDDYLDNEFEQEGFQNQTKYLTETESPEKAEKYIEKVLDHHEVPKNEWDEKKDELLVTEASRKEPEQLSLNLKAPKEPLPEVTKEDREKFLKDLEEGNFKAKPRSRVKLLSDMEKKYRQEKLQEILDAIKPKKAGIAPIQQGFPEEEVFKWLDSVTASRVYKNISEKLKSAPTASGDKKQEILSAIKTVSDFITDEGGSVDIKYPPFNLNITVEDDVVNIICNGKKYNDLSPEDAEKVLWNNSFGLISVYLQKCKGLLETIDHNSDDIDLVMYYNLLNECKKYPLIKVGPVNKLNIKYKGVVFKFVYTNTAGDANLGEFYDDAAAVIEENGDIKIFCNSAAIKTKELFIKYLSYLRNSVHHELMHANQNSSVHAFGLPNIQKEKKDIHNVLSDDAYYLDEYEFYPNIFSSAESFKSIWGNAPPEVKKLAAAFAVGQAKQIPKQFKIYSDEFEVYPFFETLKKYDEERWKKAVKEFIKATLM